MRQLKPSLAVLNRSMLCSFLVALFAMAPASGNATTCAGATILNPVSIPITNQALVCGGANDLNSTNVPGTLCGSGANAGYKNGFEALYRLTPTTTGNYQVTVSGQTWSSVQVWNGCPNGGGTCVYGNGNAGATTNITVALTAGVQYYIWFDTWPTPNSPCPGTFSIAMTVPPANDNPCGATVLNVATTCSAVSATTVFATGTTGPPTPTCASYAGGDVWFSLTVPASGAVILETFAGTITDAGMAVYTAPNCSGTFVQEYCDDDAMPGASLMPYLSMTGLAPGTTIWVRVWEYGNDVSGTFSICARTPPPPPAGDCVYVLNLFDSWGDGWGSSNVGVRINGVGGWTYYTVGGSNNQVLIGMMLGDLIELSYNASGPDQGENSYSLGLLGGGNYFNSGSAPAAGPSFGHLVDCQPPPAAPQDCTGGFTVCSGQAFNNNSSNTGNVVDLNSSNRGCLTLGERQGTWYYFSPSANGVLGFTIAPVITTTDYDFAVWGPMSSVTCPPPSAPVRCSYAAPTGNTGLGNGATDFSEDASGDRWVSTLNVIAGQIYILYVDNFSSNGQAFNLTWQLSGGASLDCSLLPVTLFGVAATTRVTAINIEWNTSSENGSDHFVIERSADGLSFAPIGILPAAGWSSTSLDYNFLDETPGPGTKYYRIAMVDNSGLSTLSPVVSAFVDRIGNNHILAPNPVNDLLYITFRTPPKVGTHLHVIDGAGRIVLSRRLSMADATTTRTFLPTQALDAGVYTLAVYDAEGAPIAFSPFVRE